MKFEFLAPFPEFFPSITSRSASHEFLWVPSNSLKFPWVPSNSLKFPWLLRVKMRSVEFFWVPLSFLVIYGVKWVQMSSHEFYRTKWVPLSSFQFPRVPLPLLTSLSFFRYWSDREINVKERSVEISSSLFLLFSLTCFFYEHFHTQLVCVFFKKHVKFLFLA